MLQTNSNVDASIWPSWMLKDLTLKSSHLSLLRAREDTAMPRAEAHRRRPLCIAAILQVPSLKFRYFTNALVGQGSRLRCTLASSTCSRLGMHCLVVSR